MSSKGLSAWDSESHTRFVLRIQPDGESELVVNDRVQNRFTLDTPLEDLTMAQIKAMIRDVQEKMGTVQGPVCGVVMYSQLGNDWTAEHHLQRYSTLIPIGFKEA
jgi:hypothetical protein